MRRVLMRMQASMDSKARPNKQGKDMVGRKRLDPHCFQLSVVRTEVEKASPVGGYEKTYQKFQKVLNNQIKGMEEWIYFMGPDGKTAKLCDMTGRDKNGWVM